MAKDEAHIPQDEAGDEEIVTVALTGPNGVNVPAAMAEGAFARLLQSIGAGAQDITATAQTTLAAPAPRTAGVAAEARAAPANG